MDDSLSRRFTPYCGAAPTPTDIAAHWNFDGPLIAVLLLLLAAYFADNMVHPRERWRSASFACGWLVAAFALTSPLCPLSVALFSARVGEHMILTTISAPLVALGRPFARGWAMQPLAAAAAFAAALWFWHAPAAYDASFTSDAAYWSMQITLFATALWFWNALFNRVDHGFASGALAVFATTGQMGLLGAIITFAGRPLYAAHLVTTFAWGMTPLQDQQLGGAVMWIPAGAIFAAALAGGLSQLMRQTEFRSAKVA